MIERASLWASATISSASRLRRVLGLGRRLLGGDERRREQLLALLELAEPLLDVLDLVGQLAALAPDLLEAVGDVLEQLVDVARL